MIREKLGIINHTVRGDTIAVKSTNYTALNYQNEICATVVFCFH